MAAYVTHGSACLILLLSQSNTLLTGQLMPCRVRLPKGLDLENPGPPPDPERWLPKWQRSDFTKKKRNRQQRREKVGPLLLSRRMVDMGCSSPNTDVSGRQQIVVRGHHKGNVCNCQLGHVTAGGRSGQPGCWPCG